MQVEENREVGARPNREAVHPACCSNFLPSRFVGGVDKKARQEPRPTRLGSFRNVVLALAFLFSTWTTILAAEVSVPSAWKYYQTLTLSQTGFVKIALPPETMNLLGPELNDLRLFSANGRETPYLIEAPVPVAPRIAPIKSVSTTIQGRFTILEIETGTEQPIEAVLLESPVSAFMKSATVEGSNNRNGWQILAQSKPLFRLANGTAETAIHFSPTRESFLRVTVSDERSASIPFAKIRVVVRPPDDNPPRPLSIKAPENENLSGETRVSIHLGAANLFVSAIDLDATEPFYKRFVSVLVPRVRENEIIEEQIASGEISRVGLDEKTTSENRRIAVERQIPSERLTLAIRNSDAPPLHLGNAAVQYRPFVIGVYVQEAGVFDLAEGNPQASAPKYEMNLARSDLARVKISDAELGTVQNNPAYHPPEALPGIADRGAQIDLRDWKFRKQIQTAGPGIYQVQLDPETLSLAAAGLQDLRVVEKDAQLPYLLQRTTAFANLPPQWGPTNLPNRAALSAWKITLPFESLPICRITARVETAFFQRTLSVYELDENRREVSDRHWLGQATWTRKPNETNTTFSIELNARPRSKELLLETDNGDNPPISIQSLTIAYPITRVLFKTGSGPTLFLYFGNEEVHTPQYDLAIAGEQIIKAERKPGTLGTLERLQPAGFTFSSKGTSIAFWGALVIVVAGLLILVGRLLPAPRE
jgi:hypothetical protein